ncbi:MAG: pullulanase [Mycobacterium sp.]|nr:pullulanase [Mycobacterium sp.]
MDYCLDAGDGTATIWTGPASVDLDGDGLFDDLMSDDDGDGLADHAALDLDDDGTAEARYTDDGSGSWALGAGASARPLRWFGLDGVEHAAAESDVDVDGDGTADRLLDTDRDGLADRAITGAAGRGYVDTDGDGGWDVMLIDTDGDGAADGAAGL